MVSWKCFYGSTIVPFMDTEFIDKEKTTRRSEDEKKLIGDLKFIRYHYAKDGIDRKHVTALGEVDVIFLLEILRSIFHYESIFHVYSSRCAGERKVLKA